MVDHKDEVMQSARPAQAKRAVAAPNSQETGREGRPPVAVVPRRQRYLVGIRAIAGLGSLHADPFLERLTRMDGVQVIRRSSHDTAAHGTASNGASEQAAPQFVVVLMDAARGQALRRNAPSHIIVEVDAPIGNSDLIALEPFGWQQRARAMPYPRARRELRFCVLGEGDRPLANTSVNLYGPGFPTQAYTNAAGQASVQTFAAEPADIQAVYLRPAAGYWERYIANPEIDFDAVSVIRLAPLASLKSAGEVRQTWGQRVMNFDCSSADWSGVGVKIGLIDSGCDTTHPALTHIVHGAAAGREGGGADWKTDELGYGTHCAGIIGAAASADADLCGCAPGAELHVFKVAPGGHCSDLLAALELCAQRRLDLVQIGVSAETRSELIAQKIAALRAEGIACIVGAGNSGGPVEFPADNPAVLCVGAIGRMGEYPADTRHAQRVLPGLVAADGLFATYFSAWGGAVAVSAPGVGVLSCVPGGGYAAWDGTAMAAAHVSGIAALLLSHHPLLQSCHDRRDERVAILFALIRAMAQPLPQADPLRVGAGVPGLARAPAMLAPWAIDSSLLTGNAPSGLLGRLSPGPAAGAWL